MNFNNYTIKSQEAIQQAQVIANGFEHQQIENEHIFKGILETDDNVLPYLLKKYEIDNDTLTKVIEAELKRYPKVSGGQTTLSQSTGKTLTQAQTIANKMKDDYVTIEHLILAIIDSKSAVSKILNEHGITKKKSYIFNY